MLKKLFVFFICLLLPFTIFASDISQNILTVEIEGISLSTPLEAIPEILKNHGYNQTSSTTYTKRTQVEAQRRSIHRIVIEDTNSLRQINYIREKSGGRIKSPSKVEKPILESEVVTAEAIYQFVCINVSEKIQTERSCQPASTSNIIFNQGNVMQIGSNLEVSLKASAASTAIHLRYFKK